MLLYIIIYSHLEMGRRTVVRYARTTVSREKLINETFDYSNFSMEISRFGHEEKYQR
jgi:hypothetical protein